jgi:hypothetical protein
MVKVRCANLAERCRACLKALMAPASNQTNTVAHFWRVFKINQGSAVCTAVRSPHGNARGRCGGPNGGIAVGYRGNTGHGGMQLHA